MRIAAKIQNRDGENTVSIQTDGSVRSLTIPPKAAGTGSSVNGGELLFLALATCYCNDIYREAAQRGIRVVDVEVTVDGEFGAAGEPARNVTYGARVSAQTNEADILDLMKHTDTVAEIQNTLRTGATVRLSRMEAKTV